MFVSSVNRATETVRCGDPGPHSELDICKGEIVWLPVEYICFDPWHAARHVTLYFELR